MKELKKVLKNLNKKHDMDFQIRTTDGRIEIFDSHESYSIDWLEEQNCLMHDCAEEFGFKFVPILNDKIHDAIEEAVRKDFGSETYLEWEDAVTMVVAR